jgi:hypothetical protein
LRRIHNFALGMGWIAWFILAKKQWPEVRFAEKRAITWDEHLKILDREPNKEKAAFYELAWHIGAPKPTSPTCAPKKLIGAIASSPSRAPKPERLS